MWRRLENGEYSHILLGPEQATHHRFLRILRSAKFNQRLAFIAVDELHTVFQWRDFRAAYPDIHRLRTLVPYDTPWFGCTATLSKEDQPGALRLIRLG
jgi:superfamily II DNA helicase RecQ